MPHRSHLLRAAAALVGVVLAGCALLTAHGVTHPAAAASPAGTRVRYGTDAGQPLFGWILRPRAAGPTRRAAVLLVHGGAWVHGSAAEMQPAARALATAGFVTLDIDYRLASATHPGFPGELDDLRQAVGFLRSHAATYDVDPRRIGALGSSAGADLVSLLAAVGHGPLTVGDRVAAAVSWSAPFDVTGYGTVADARCPQTATTCSHLVQMALLYVGCRHRACPDRWRQADVATHVTRDDPPMLLFNSSDELIPASQARAMAATLARAHVTHQLVVLPGRRHAAAYAETALPRTIAFLRQHLERPARAA